MSNSALALATALVSDVAQGKTFYAGDKTLKTGTLVPYKYATGTCETKTVYSGSSNWCSVSGLSFKPYIVVVTGQMGEEWNNYFATAFCMNDMETGNKICGAMVSDGRAYESTGCTMYANNDGFSIRPYASNGNLYGMVDTATFFAIGK